MRLSSLLPLLRNGGSAPAPSANMRVAIQGQSNALGTYAYRADLASGALATSDPGLASFDNAPISRVYIWNHIYSEYQQLRLGVNNLGAALDMFGPEVGLAVRWMRETSSGNLYIDKRAEGGQPITYFMSGGAFYSAFSSAHASANAWLSTRSITATHKGWLWVQGEFDFDQTEAWYRGNLDTLTSSRLTDGLQPSDGKLLLVQMRPGTVRYGAGVAAAKTAYAAVHSATAMTMEMSAEFHSDNLHLNARGQLQLGYDAYEHLFGAAHVTA